MHGIGRVRGSRYVVESATIREKEPDRLNRKLTCGTVI